MATNLTARGARANTAARLPALPASTAVDPARRQWEEMVREWLEVRLGARGDFYERAVTHRELKDQLDRIQTATSADELDKLVSQVALLRGQVNALLSQISNVQTLLNSNVTNTTNSSAQITNLYTQVRDVAVEDVAVFAVAMRPTQTGGCSAITTVEFGAGQPNFHALLFDSTTDESADFHTMLPFGWAGRGFRVYVYWGHGSGASSFDVTWEVTANSTYDNETLILNFVGGVVVTDSGGTAGNLYVAQSDVVPIASYSNDVGSLISVRIYRRPTHSGDNLNIDAALLAVRFELADIPLVEPDYGTLVPVANLSLLLNCNGTDLSTVFIDSSPIAGTITRVSTPVISTSQSKYGGASLAVLQQGGLSAPDGTHFSMATGDFTIGCWVRRIASATNDTYITKSITNGAYPWQLWYDNSTGKFGFRGFDTTVSLVYNLQSSTTPAADTWYFLVGEREGNTFRLRVNGTVEASTTFSGTLLTVSVGVTVGSLSNATGSAAAYLDDVFIVKGSAVGATLGTPTGQLTPA